MGPLGAISRALRSRLIAELTQARLVDEDDGSMAELEVIALARELHAFRRERFDHLPRHVLGEAAWDVLLTLFIADAEHRTLTLAQLERESGVSYGSTFRSVTALAGEDLVQKSPDTGTRNRVLISLSDKGRAAMRATLASWPGLRR